jgi:hypothetical protein
MKEDTVYQALFAEATELKIYGVCVNLYFTVDRYFKKERASIRAIYRNNLRYHVMMQLAWKLNGSRPVHPSALRNLKVSSLTDADIKSVLDHTIALFDQGGAEDRLAKGEAFTITLQQQATVKTSTLAITSPAATPATT